MASALAGIVPVMTAARYVPEACFTRKHAHFWGLEAEDDMATRVRGSIPLKVLFIGNSFTARNDVPGLIAQLAAVRGKNLSRPRSRVLVVTTLLVTVTRSVHPSAIW